jgi:16S rRNA (cytosine1402-N4)-methyltransferase
MASEPGSAAHRPVLYNEIIHALRPFSGGFYVDGTLGAGGHAEGILQASQPDGRLLGLDVDPQALALAAERLAPFGKRTIIRQASYIQMRAELDALGQPLVDGIVLDLGVSSMQLDTPERGFSFQADAPLDMRFDPTNPLQAAELVNTWSEKELAGVIYKYGEDDNGARIARAIVQARPIHTTGELAEVIRRAVGGRAARPGGRGRKATGGKHIHPATRTFQALRIVVNRELEAVEQVLPQAVAALKPGGRLAVIAFHSLEDRIVKQYFRLESQDCICPPRQPVCTCGHKASIRELNRRPLSPTDEEIEQNPRARSARLRVAERLDSESAGM